MQFQKVNLNKKGTNEPTTYWNQKFETVSKKLDPLKLKYENVLERLLMELPDSLFTTYINYHGMHPTQG